MTTVLSDCIIKSLEATVRIKKVKHLFSRTTWTEYLVIKTKVSQGTVQPLLVSFGSVLAWFKRYIVIFFQIWHYVRWSAYAIFTVSNVFKICYVFMFGFRRNVGWRCKLHMGFSCKIYPNVVLQMNYDSLLTILTYKRFFLQTGRRHKTKWTIYIKQSYTLIIVSKCFTITEQTGRYW